MLCPYVVAAGLLAVVLDPAGQIAVAPPPREVVPKPVVPRINEYHGHVLAVGRQWITIRGSDNFLPNAEVVTRRFPAGEHLTAGNQDPAFNSSSDYRLTDVRVGDRVYIRLRELGEVDVCAAVRIERRPGGIVPPAPWDEPDSAHPHHEMMNAWQAFEEKGIPLPPKYDPVVQQRKAQAEARLREAWVARRQWEEDHTAPPPRKPARVVLRLRDAPPKTGLPRPTDYHGHVLAVDGRSITIRGTETGLPTDEDVICRFPVGAALAAGEQDADDKSSADYRLADVRAGDRASVRLRPRADDDVCVSVRIERRPGGVVPPAPWDDLGSDKPYHVLMNEWQAFEERTPRLRPKHDPPSRRIKELERLQELQAASLRQSSEQDRPAPPPRNVVRPAP